MASSICLLVILFAARALSYSENQERSATISYVAKFDNVNADLVQGLPVRGLRPLGPYNSLNFNGMGVITDTFSIAGVSPTSAPNVLGYDVAAELEATQNITSIYRDSITDNFSLKSLYFGCQVSNTSIPTTCSILLRAYRENTKVAEQTASFVAHEPVSKMKYVELESGFREVDAVDFATNQLTGKLVDAVLLDNIAYDAVLKGGSVVC